MYMKFSEEERIAEVLEGRRAGTYHEVASRRFEVANAEGRGERLHDTVEVVIGRPPLTFNRYADEHQMARE